MGNFNKIESNISFEPVIKNYENSLRGIVIEKINNKLTKKKMFPESAGSRFISKWISHLRTILIGINTIAKLSIDQCRRRIISNSHAYTLGMILDPTVSEENMTQLSEGFNNILVDSYLGLRNDGHFSGFLRDYNTEDVTDPEDIGSLADDDEDASEENNEEY